MSAPFPYRVAILAILSFLGARAFAATSASNLFPDPFGHYTSVNTGFYLTPGGLVTLEGLILTSPTASILPPPAPGTLVWGAGAMFDAQTFMSFFGGPTTPSFNAGIVAAASITGTLDAPPLHAYDTEMLALNLTGLPLGAIIRESPTIASTGKHTIVGGGPYTIDSFFDVFTELSLDGGATWTPATASVHIHNPEPGSLAVLASAGAMLICRRRQRTA